MDGLQGHKAHGPDGIPARLLKEFAHNMASLLTHIYKASLNQCRLCCDWKTTLVFPIYKKGPCKNPSNYRPISLTSKPCKILKHLMYTSVYNHLETTVVWKYFVVKKFSWAITSTKIFYSKILSTNS